MSFVRNGAPLMKTTTKLILGGGVVLALAFVSATAGAVFFGQPMTWSDIEATGGAQLSSPYRGKDGWYVDTAIDISGTKRGSTQFNSGLVCSWIKVRKDGPTITLTAYSGVATVAKGTSLCAPARLGELAPGTYSILYGRSKRSTHPLGTIIIPDAPSNAH